MKASPDTPFGWKAGGVHDMRPTLFAPQMTIYGFEVVAADTGRPVTESYPSKLDAMEVAATLTTAAETSRIALSKVLAGT